MKIDTAALDTWTQTVRRVRNALADAGIDATVRTENEPFVRLVVDVVDDAAVGFAVFHIEQALGRTFGVYCDLGEALRKGTSRRPIIVWRVPEHSGRISRNTHVEPQRTCPLDSIQAADVSKVTR